MELIKYKNSVKTHISQYSLIEKLSEKIKLDIPQINLLRSDIELIRYILVVIHNEIDPTEKTIDNSQLCISILQNIFSDLSEQEVNTIYKSIEFLKNNNSIKRVSTSKKVKSTVWQWIKKKLL